MILMRNIRGLKLLEHVMEVLECVLERLIRSQVDINNLQFGFMPGRSTTDAISIFFQNAVETPYQ